MAADYSVHPLGGDTALSSLPYTPSSDTATTIIDIVEEIMNATAAGAINASMQHAQQNSTSDGPMGPMLFLSLGLLIIIIGVLGNAFVVTVIFTDRKLLHSSVNLFLLNLALADMLNLVSTAPDWVLIHLHQPWLFPHIFCPILRFLQPYFLFASVLLQMSIGIERYMAICTPMQMQRFSRRTTVFVLFLAWLVAGIFASPTAFSHTSPRGNTSKYVCRTSNLLDDFKFAIDSVNFAVLYCIPLVLLTTLYTIMCRRLWGKECMIAGESQQMAILRLRRSVVKMLVISMLIYFICYTPIQGIAYFHFVFSAPLKMVFTLLVMASSAANPIVYIMCCRHFHQRFVDMVKRSMRCCFPRSPEKYQTVITENEKPSSVKGRQMSRSPYVSFRRSTRRPKSTLSVTLL